MNKGAGDSGGWVRGELTALHRQLASAMGPLNFMLTRGKVSPTALLVLAEELELLTERTRRLVVRINETVS